MKSAPEFGAEGKNPMTEIERLPRFVILQHSLPEHRQLLQNKLSNRRPFPALTPLSWPGDIGTWQGVEIACFAGGEPERVILPVLQQKQVEFIFCLGLAGSLSADLQLGDLIAPSASVRGEGLTDYWADPKLPAVADMTALLALNTVAHQAGIPLANGLFFTSATWYKEPDFIADWAKLGVMGIQMELAQYYLLAHLHGKKAAGLYVISDLPLAGEAIWETGFRTDPEILAGCARSITVVLQAIKWLAGEKPPLVD